jgi:hypothetical protein
VTADPLTAELAYVEARAARDRSVQRALVVPLRLAGTAELGGAVAVLLIGRDHLASYFVPAYVLVLGVGAWWYHRYARTHGVLLPVRPWVLILAPMMVAGASLSRLGFVLDNELVQIACPPLTNAAAVLVVGMWLGSRRLLLTAVAMATATAVSVTLAAGDRAISLQLVAYGLLLWQASRSSR